MVRKWRTAATAAALAALVALPARAGVKDGVDAWSRGDYARAVAEWTKPAAAGDADAQFNLAQAYKLGKGVATDLKRAEDLYIEAANQGHLQAADTYGLLLFQTGRRKEALRWLVPSAERGEPRAQYILGIAHYNGDLVARDPVLAYALITRAAAAGLGVAAKTLPSLDESLSLEQRRKGVALAAEIEARASAQRAVQMASAGLGSPARPLVSARAGAGVMQGAVPAQRVAAAGQSPVPARPSSVTAARSGVAPAGSGGAWRIQLGAFAVAGNAQALWGRLKVVPALADRQGFFVPAGRLTKLQAGPFASRAEAQAACSRVGVAGCIPVGG